MCVYLFCYLNEIGLHFVAYECIYGMGGDIVESWLDYYWPMGVSILLLE